jgi:hypothetical protein
MTKLQNLEKEFSHEFKRDVVNSYNYPTHDFYEVQLDGYYNLEQLRQIADLLEKYQRIKDN